MFSQNEKVGQQIWLAFKESPTKEQWREKCAEKMCWLSETQIIIQPDPKLKADVDRLKQLVLWQIAHSNLSYNRKKLKSLGFRMRNSESRWSGSTGR